MIAYIGGARRLDAKPSSVPQQPCMLRLAYASPAGGPARRSRVGRVRLAALGAALVLGACVGDEGEASARDGGLSGQTRVRPTLEQACTDSCEAQAATRCPDVYPVRDCSDGCISLPEHLPSCRDAWIDLNACMATAPLFCDRVNGGAAVSSDDCGPELDAFMECPE